MHEANPGSGHTAPNLPAHAAMDRVDTEIYPSFHLGHSFGTKTKVDSSPDSNHHSLSPAVAETATVTDQHQEGNPSLCLPLCHI